MFLVHYREPDGCGCDHTIGCGQQTVKLPDSIVSLDEAIAYVEGEKDHSLSYYGGDRITSAIIYEVTSYHKIDMKKLHQRKKDKEAAEQQLSDEAVFERLKKKLGK